MANHFQREAIDGGDLNAWGNPELGQNRNTLGAHSPRLFDDSGTLKISTGRIGFDKGALKGTHIIDTETTISIAAITSGSWAKVEVETTGENTSITVSDIAASTDPAVIPSAFTGAWDGDKLGYYIESTKKVLALIWKSSGGSLDGIVNLFPGMEGYSGRAAGVDYFNIKGLDRTKEIVNVTGSGTIGNLTRDQIRIFSGALATTDTLPDLASNRGRTIVFINKDATPDLYTIQIAGTDRICGGLTSLGLEFAESFVILFGGDTEWEVLSNEVEHRTSGSDHYVRYADGRLEQWGTAQSVSLAMTGADRGFFRNGGGTFVKTYPVAFTTVDTPLISADVPPPFSSISSGTASASILCWRGTSGTETVTIWWRTIGTWK